MGIYSEYLDKSMNFPQLQDERKRVLKIVSDLRGGRDVLVFASDLSKTANNSIEYSDILSFQDQLSNLKGKALDIVLETPGGFAEVVEDLVGLARSKYEKIGVIIPGSAKSAGTIFAMAADEILMGSMSALGPIDAQIIANGKRFSADAFLDGLSKIKEEVISSRSLNPVFIPILQNISPGEIQHCENAQNFSKTLVQNWLQEYKFKYWENHASTGKPVTPDEKKGRAEEIASKLCKHSDWLTHGRSIKIDDLNKMKLKIADFSKESALNDAILRYYTLMRMTFESSNISKIFETITSQIYRFVLGPNQLVQNTPIVQNQIANIDFQCPNCKKTTRIQANIEKHADPQPGTVPYPIDDNIFKCPHCQSSNNILPIRLQIEAQSGKRVVK